MSLEPAAPQAVGLASARSAGASAGLLGVSKGSLALGCSFPDVLQSALRPAVGPAAARAPAKFATPSAGSKPRLGVSADPDDDPLHSAARQTAHLAPPPAFAPPLQAQPLASGAAAGSSPPAERAFASLEELLPALVRKIAWSGDARRGSVRLELGAGALSGATLVVRAEGAQVHVALSAPPGTNLEDWRTRIASRLAARGLDVGSLDVE
jgi:hypothetical protein